MLNHHSTDGRPKPFFSFVPIYLGTLEALVHFGTFVRTRDNGVVRMLCSNDPDDGSFQCQVCSNLDPPPPMDRPSPLLLGVQEICLTHTRVIVSPDDVVDFVFVFHPETITTAAIAAYGMTDVFICRFFREPTGHLLEEQVFSFPTDSLLFPLHFRCHPLVIWDDLLVIQESFRRCLSTTSSLEKDQWLQKEKLKISKETWVYFIRAMNRFRQSDTLCQDSIAVTKKTTCIQKRALALGMQNVSTRLQLPSEQVDFITSHDLFVLSLILGKLVLFGDRGKRPVFGTTRSLMESDMINLLVDPSDVPINCRPRKNLTYCVRMKHDGRNLWLRVQYHTYVYCTDEAGNPHRCFSPELRIAINFGRGGGTGDTNSQQENNNNLQQQEETKQDNVIINNYIIPIGVTFVYQARGLLVKTVAHDRNNATIKCRVITRGPTRGQDINVDELEAHQNLQAHRLARSHM
jgi:hypothetical protein